MKKKAVSISKDMEKMNPLLHYLWECEMPPQWKTVS
jgi:hypothetical protein